MRKAQATYHAPEGDDKVAEMGGVTFFDGQSVELNTDDHGHMIGKLQGNPHFDVELGEEEEGKRGPGRPKKRDLKAGIEEARDHDFEADQRAQAARKTPEPAPAKASAE
jgi:hypothetical protein